MHTFTAPTVAEAMARVRSALGEDAVIISTRTDPRGRGAQIVAAVEAPDADAATFDAWETTDAAPRDGAPTISASDGLRRSLLYHGVPSLLVDRLLRAARQPDEFADSADTAPVAAQASPAEHDAPALAAALDACLNFQPLAEARVRRPLLLVGPSGGGKTLAAARLIVAAHQCGRDVVAASADTRRAGGIEQLEAFTRILGIPLTATEQPAGIASVLAGAGSAAVMIDTPGVNPYAAGEMQALGRLVQTAGAEPLLVMAAGSDPLEAADVATAFARIGCRRMLVTRLDVTRRLGALLAAGDIGRLALAGVCISPHAADPPAALAPLSLARLLLSTTPHDTPTHLQREALR
jgi:flagellar biosynthesis protein FlhF